MDDREKELLALYFEQAIDKKIVTTMKYIHGCEDPTEGNKTAKEYLNKAVEIIARRT